MLTLTAAVLLSLAPALTPDEAQLAERTTGVRLLPAEETLVRPLGNVGWNIAGPVGGAVSFAWGGMRLGGQLLPKDGAGVILGMYVGIAVGVGVGFLAAYFARRG